MPAAYHVALNASQTLAFVVALLALGFILGWFVRKWMVE